MLGVDDSLASEEIYIYTNRHHTVFVNGVVNARQCASLRTLRLLKTPETLWVYATLLRRPEGLKLQAIRPTE